MTTTFLVQALVHRKCTRFAVRDHTSCLRSHIDRSPKWYIAQVAFVVHALEKQTGRRRGQARGQPDGCVSRCERLVVRQPAASDFHEHADQAAAPSSR